MIRRYSNTDFDYTDTNAFELQNIGDGERRGCTKIIVTKNEDSSQITIFHSLINNRSLSIRYVALALLIFSMPQNASGSQLGDIEVSRTLCQIQESVCNLIRVTDYNDSYVSKVLKSSFVAYQKIILNSSNSNFSKPWKLPTDDFNLSTLNKIVTSNINNLCVRLNGYSGCKVDSNSICGLMSNNGKFCNENYDIDNPTWNGCCSSIFSHLYH